MKNGDKNNSAKAISNNGMLRYIKPPINIIIKINGNPTTNIIALAIPNVALKENTINLNTRTIIPIENNKLNIQPPYFFLMYTSERTMPKTINNIG